MAGEFIFITGGARSGKSRLAESLASSHPGPVAYIPTAAITDGEMKRRVQLHRRRRPVEWQTIECGASLADTIAKAASTCACILVDCLTIYCARLLPQDLPDSGSLPPELAAAVEERVAGEIEAALGAIRTACQASGCDVIVVSNEVGGGIVPAFPSGRLFRDLLGQANRELAAAADHCYLVVAGVPLDLKALAATPRPWGEG